MHESLVDDARRVWEQMAAELGLEGAGVSATVHLDRDFPGRRRGAGRRATPYACA